MESIAIGIQLSASGMSHLDSLNSGLGQANRALKDTVATVQMSTDFYREHKQQLIDTIRERNSEIGMTERQRISLAALNSVLEQQNQQLAERRKLDEAAAGFQQMGYSDAESIELAKFHDQLVKEVTADEKLLNEVLEEGLAVKERSMTLEEQNLNLKLAVQSAQDGYGSNVSRIETEAHATMLLENTYNRLSIAVDDNRKYYEQLYMERERLLEQATMQRTLTLDQIYALEELDDQTRSVALNEETMNEVNREYYNLVKGGMTDQQAAYKLAGDIVYQKYLDEEATIRGTIAEKNANTERGKSRQELMQMSIGMFVLGITTTQTLGALSKMTEAIPVLSQTFKEMQGAVKLILGPMQIFYSLQQLITMENKKMLLSALPLMAAFGGIYLLLRAFNQESPIVRFGLGAMAAAMLVLAAATWTQTEALWAKVKVQLAAIATNPLTALSTPIYIAAGMAAVSAGIAMAAFGGGNKGQTIPDYARQVKETGLFYAHKGEYVGRVGAMQPSSSNNNVVVNINIGSGAVVDDSMITKLSREIQKTVASGNGV